MHPINERFSPPSLLTIAGSDSGGGAGIQADLKTFQALGCYGMSVVTALTAQNTIEVKSIYPVSPAFIEEQMSAVFEDIGVDAIKVGMLHSTSVIEIVEKNLKLFDAKLVVVDPVMVAKAGNRLLDPNSVHALRDLLFPLSTLLTPNIPEAEILLGRSISTKDEMENAARELLLYVPNVVIKGGHLVDSATSSDFFVARTGESRWLEYPRVHTKNTHGTGCTYSSAIAAYWDEERGFWMRSFKREGISRLR